MIRSVHRNRLTLCVPGAPLGAPHGERTAHKVSDLVSPFPTCSLVPGHRCGHGRAGSPRKVRADEWGGCARRAGSRARPGSPRATADAPGVPRRACPGRSARVGGRRCGPGPSREGSPVFQVSPLHPCSLLPRIGLGGAFLVALRALPARARPSERGMGHSVCWVPTAGTADSRRDGEEARPVRGSKRQWTVSPLHGRPVSHVTVTLNYVLRRLSKV